MGSEGGFIFGTVILCLKLAIKSLAYMDASWNAYGKMSLRGFSICPYIRPGYNMTEQRNKVCGVDIHKKFLIATILSRDGTKMQKRFGTDVDDLLNFRDWVIKEYWYVFSSLL